MSDHLEPGYWRFVLCEHHATVVAACILLAHVDDETVHRIAADLAGACPACIEKKETK